MSPPLVPHNNNDVDVAPTSTKAETQPSPAEIPTATTPSQVRSNRPRRSQAVYKDSVPVAAASATTDDNVPPTSETGGKGRKRTQASSPVATRKRARSGDTKKSPLESDVVTEEDRKPAAKESCCICMCDVEADDLAGISGCEHFFCFNCIEQWAERENSCPLCKVRFTKIDRVNKKRKKGQKNTKKVKTRDQRSGLPGAALESILASFARRGQSVGVGDVTRLIFSGSTIAFGMGNTSLLGTNAINDMFEEEDVHPFDAFFRAVQGSQVLRPVTFAATAHTRSYASNGSEVTAGNENNPLTIDDSDEDGAVEVVDQPLTLLERQSSAPRRP